MSRRSGKPANRSWDSATGSTGRKIRGRGTCAKEVKRLSEEMGQPHWHAILEALVDTMRPYARHGVNVNVDFYAGVVYYLHGIPEDLFVPIFAIGRIPGWTVQVMEQLDNNILIRPRLLYTGPEAREFVPVGERG